LDKIDGSLISFCDSPLSNIENFMTDAPAPLPANPLPTEASAPEPSVKSVTFIRRSAIYALLAFGVIGAGLFPFVVEPWILGQVRQSLTNQGLSLSEDSQLSVSIFGASITGSQLTLNEIDGAQGIFVADSLIADLALMESASSGDIVFTKMTLDGLKGSFRRTTSGRIPFLQSPDDPPGKPIDWLGLGKQLMDWYKKYAPEGSETTDPKDPNQPPSAPSEPVPPKGKPATDWPKAVRYTPQPQPGTPWPRIIIRDLSITGTTFGLPDDTPFDITGFRLIGSDVALRLLPNEIMKLDGDITTKGSGPFTLKVNRVGGKTGTMQLNAKDVSLKALSDPAISGAAMAPYGTSGTTDLSIDTNWTGWQQTSAIICALRDVTMHPSNDANDNAKQLASAINAFGGKPVIWQPQVGGTLYAPVFTDFGLKSLQNSAIDAGKQKALEEGTKALNKELEKNPELKNATDKAKDLFKGFGK
jgi:hypothetical protein